MKPRLLAACLLFVGLAAPTWAQGVCPQGVEALRDEAPEAAVAAFEDCLGRQQYPWPVEAELRSRLGAAHLALGQGEEALLAYNQVFALIESNGGDARTAFARRNRGAALLMVDRPEDALEDLDIVLERAPQDAFAHVLAGSAYLDLDRPEEALVAFDAAVRAEPDFLNGWIGRSAAFIDLDMHDASVDDAREAMAIAPDDAGALNALCWALVQADRAADALPTCEAAVAADPESGAITHSLAAALEQIGETPRAIELYARAYELSPDDDEIAADYERTRSD